MSPPSHDILRARFHDAEELAKVARTWDLDFRQLTPGLFEGDLWQITDGPVQVSRCRLAAHVHQCGSAPAGVRTLALLAHHERPIRWRGQEVTADHLMCFPQDGELESVSPPGFDVFTLTFPEELLETVARDLDLPGVLQLGSGGQVLTPHPDALRRLRRLLLELHGISGAGPAPGGLPEDTWLEAALNQDVPHALIRALAPRDPARPITRPPIRSRDVAMQRALRTIEAQPTEALTVAALCRQACVSERTLQYAFMESFGVTPKVFLRARRLHGVRQELTRATRGHVSVTLVANRWGFWHLGQLAHDYARLFGERPSHTLARSRPG